MNLEQAVDNNCCNLKVKLGWWELHLVGILGLQTWETISQVTLRELSERGKEGKEPIYTEVLPKRGGSLNTKKLLLFRKQDSHFKEFNISLCRRRCKSLGLLRSFLSLCISSYVDVISWKYIATLTLRPKAQEESMREFAAHTMKPEQISLNVKQRHFLSKIE